MKKFLIATTALALTAGAAAADVKISGYGRTGVVYQEDRGVDLNDAIIQSRLRMNIDASTSSDAGVDFGGRIRLQWDQGRAETRIAPGYVYVTASGLRVEIGNSNTAFDSAGLLYAPEIGLQSSTRYNLGSFYSYNTSPNPADYVGIMGSYTLAGVTLRASVVDPDQLSAVDGLEKEYGLSADYTWNNVELSAAAVWNGASIEDNDQYFVGARYSYNDVARIGLNWIDNGVEAAGQTVVLYGDYKVAPMTTVNAYVANNDAVGNVTDTVFGVGAEYDLGGAKLLGSVQRDHNEAIYADMGVRFDF